jgi:surface polysaccharide O-acyltransferase-like enzyme
MKLGKAIKLNNSVWFYSSIILLIFILCGLEVSKVTILKTFMPISYNEYWFFSCYLILYLISPILNTVINNSDKRKMKMIIVTNFILLSFLPYITKGQFYQVSGGYSLYNFVLLYFMGAYIRKYPIDKNYFVKYFTKNAQRILLLMSVFIFAGINFLLYYFGSNIQSSSNNLVREIGSIFTNGFSSYNNPLLIIQSVCYFSLFTVFEFKNKFINKISVSTFGVYLLSDNFYVRGWLYKFLGFTKDHYNIKILFYLAICCLVVFIVCILIEMLRQFIFKIIYNLKISAKNRVWYRNYIKSLGINVNW